MRKKNQPETVKGFKVFNPDFTCNGYQYKENETFTYEGKIEICARGFHFCEKASHCFQYYSFDKNNIVCEVEALGDIQRHNGDSKVVTNILKVGRRLSWEEVLKVANEGMDNTGHSNSGDSNSGDRNSGDSNSGNRNSGYWNSGNWNSGYWNSGNRNSGNWNSGDSNSGNRNSGNWNSGDSNSGYWNSGNWNSGAFCTLKPTMTFFDKPSKMTFEEFEKSRAYSLLCDLNINMWISSSDMSAEEKTKYPSHETTGGFLKTLSYKEAFTNAWGNWSAENRKAFTDLPNFDAEKFEHITGVKI